MKIPKGLRLDLHKHSSFSMEEIGDGLVPLVITSPLYFPESLINRLSQPINNDHDEIVEEICSYARNLFPVFVEIERVLCPGGHLVIQTRDVRICEALIAVESIHREMVEQTGLFLISRYLWLSNFKRAARQNLLEKLKKELGPIPPDPEVFLVFQKPGNSYLGEPLKEDEEFLSKNFMTTATGKLKSRHPYQAPLPVLQSFVRTYSRPLDIILDPFAGCGTTAMAALKNNRHAVLYEIDPAAIEMIENNFRE